MTHSHTGPRRSVITGLVAATLLLAGCSSPAPAATGGAESSDELTPVTVGVFAVVDVAPLYLGVQKGFFEAEGLDLDVQILDGGAATAAAVMAGDMQFGYSGTLSVVIAGSRGLPITIVAPGVASGVDAKEGTDANAAVVVAADSAIENAADLAGKTVAINTLGNILEATLKNSLEEADVDPASVNFVEIPFPEMTAALAAGQVDAAFMLEPFITASELAEGTQAVIFPFEELAPSLNNGVYFSTLELLQSDPELVSAFQDGLRTSVEYANEHPDELRAVVPDFLSIPTDVVDAMTFPQLITEADVSHYAIFRDLGKRYGLVQGETDLDQLTAGLDQ